SPWSFSVPSPPTPKIRLGGGGRVDFKRPKPEEWWVAFCSWVSDLFSFGTEFHVTKFFHLYLGGKKRPYIKTLPMPKCLSPASPIPDWPVRAHRW
uniref:Uncharacterized protein n=1 Tax=Canis lupus familiaris TaxID=9615 RepID=A0A8P0TH27_CANLF